MYTIGELSRLSRVSVKTLRYYDEVGVLPPAHVTPSSGYRRYTSAQLEQLNRVLVLRDLGFSLREIRSLLATGVPAAEVLVALRQKLGEIERDVEEERARLARGAALLAALERSGEAAARDVAVRSLRPQLVASVRDRIDSHEESARLFEELDREVGALPRRRQYGAIWHACGEDGIDCEAFVILASPVVVAGRASLRELPAARAASIVYRGEVDYLRHYRAARAWIDASGAVVAGPKREVYLDVGGPDSEPITELQIPIEGRCDRPERPRRRHPRGAA